jgi:ATP-dependent DNA helicase RecG
VVFGTRRIIEEGVVWKRLGLVVVEERGPYGTVSPQQLAGRGAQPDLLVVTRAPIPSTLAFTVFGDFDVSVVPTDDRPRCSQAVLPAAQQSEAYAKAREEIEAGRQVFIVFPVRDGKDLLSLDDAMRFGKALQVDALPGARIGVYCSGMAAKDRHQVFDDFQHRRMDVLVCTTYIEDAPVVANANVLIVHYADLCDMVRLHRLRGHVGLGAHAGHSFFVLSDRPSEAGAQAIDLVMGERDGFRLAEVDLTVRGPEALLGDRAGEMPELRWADPPRDRELLLRARAEAFSLLVEDPGLRRNVEIAKAVTTRWGDWLGSASTPAEGKASKGSAAVDKNARRGRRRRRRR